MSSRTLSIEQKIDQLIGSNKTLRRELTRAQRRIAQLEKGIGPGFPIALNTQDKTFVEAVNELEDRPYDERRMITEQRFGCRVLSESQLSRLTKNELYTLAKNNAERLTNALKQKVPLAFPKGILVLDREVKSTKTAVDIEGKGYESVIRLLPPRNGAAETNCLVLDVSSGPQQIFVKNLVFEAGGNFTSSIALTVKGFPTQPADERIYSKPLGRIENVHIRGQNTYNTPPPWPNAFFGGIQIINPNILTIEGCVVQGNGYVIDTNTNRRTVLPFMLPAKLGLPQMVSNAGSFGFKLIGNRASIENKLKFCEAYDVQTGIIAYTPEWIGPFKPGIEGLRIDGCSFAGVYDGIWIESRSYGTPGFWIGNGTHVAASRKAIFGRNIRQGWIENCLIYNKGNDHGYVNFASFIELRECSDFRITGNDCNYFHPPGAPETYNDAYGFLLQGKVINGEYYNPSVANFIGGGNYIVNTKPNCSKPAIWLQGDFTNNNQVPENQNMVFGYKNVVLTNNPYNYIGKHMPSDPADGYTPAHNMALSREILGEYLNEFGERVSGVIGRTLNPSGATLNRDNDGFWILDLEGCRSDTVFVASRMIAERGPGDESTDIPYTDFVLKGISMRFGRSIRLMSERTITLKHNPAKLYLQGQRDLKLEPFEVIWLTYRADGNYDRVEEVGRDLSGEGRLVTTADNLAPGLPYTLNASIWPFITNSNEQFWHLQVNTKYLGGITYEYQQATNLFRPISIFRVKKGDGWSAWMRTDNSIQAISDPNTDLPAGQYYIEATLYPGCGSWYLTEYRVNETNISYRAQTAIGLAGNYIITRRKENGTWTAWKRVGNQNVSGASAILADEFGVGFDAQSKPQLWLKGNDGTAKKITQVDDYIPTALRNPIDFELMAYNYYVERPQRIGINDLVYAMLYSSGSGLLGELDNRYVKK